MIRIVTPLTRLSTLPKLPALLLSLFLGLALVASCGGDDLSHFGDGDDTGTDDLIKGTIKGAICAVEDGIGSGEGYWLVGARVYVVYDSQVYQALTEQSGVFTLEGVPVGDHELQVEKGSFSASTPVTVRANDITNLQPVCVDPITRLAVVTGVFDSIENMLSDVGFNISDCLPADGTFCPDTLDPAGSVTLVEGWRVGTPPAAPHFVTHLLNDPIAMGEFKVIFFNCGLTDDYIASAPVEMHDNLRKFVADGGSIYVSDWAYELLRVVFPGTLNFFGNDSERNSAKVGMMNMTSPGSIADELLEAQLATNTIDLAFNKGKWVVLDEVQPANVSIRVLTDAALDIDGDSVEDLSLSNIPALISVPYGDGQIVFTSFHTHEQAGALMNSVFHYVIFEL